ncbi:MAG: AMP-binding protein [Deltaproteobacteria bacterium]|nr:AMP-binding protein [Deltaproteobacteria bacterium]
MIVYTEKQIEELDKFYKHPRNLVDLFEDTAAKWGDRNAIGTKNLTTKQYEWITYKHLAERINNARGGLHQLGVNKGDAVGVIIGNSVEWYVFENASQGLGAMFVPMYENELMKIWQYIIKDSGLKYLFVKDEKLFEKIKHFKDEIESLKDIFIIYGEGPNSLQALEEAGKKNPVKSHKPHWAEPAELIYTSGTTGEPKGVLLSHGNLSACSQAGYHIYPALNENSISLAILPWAHSYGLSAELHNFMQFGGAIALMESVDTLAEDFLKVRPTYLIAVPKVFNRIYDGIQAKMHADGGLKKMLFDMTCREAVKCRGKENKSLKFKILDKIVFSKIRERFGGKLTGVLTASAVMNPEIAMFFADLGIPTYDAYGLTETSPAITMNSPLLGNRYGSVGKCVENMHVKIDKSVTDDDSDDGEIIVYGAHVMMGYHNKPDETAKIMMKDNWKGFPGIRTGDQGRLTDDGFLYITGRFKDEYKLSNGKYIHPESIETDIKLLHNITNAFVWGEGKAYNIAVIVPDFATMKKDDRIAKWAQGSPREVVKDKNIQYFLSEEIKRHLKKSYGGYEIPQKFIFTSEDFTLENGLVTQTMKLKRKEALKAYSTEIEKLY